MPFFAFFYILNAIYIDYIAFKSEPYLLLTILVYRMCLGEVTDENNVKIVERR